MGNRRQLTGPLIPLSSKGSSTSTYCALELAVKGMDIGLM